MVNNKCQECGKVWVGFSQALCAECGDVKRQYAKRFGDDALAIACQRYAVRDPSQLPLSALSQLATAILLGVPLSAAWRDGMPI